MLKLNDAGLPDLMDLVPPLDRLNRDKGENEELATLLAVLQSQADAIAMNINQLYDNWFIESCSDWAVPYIAKLLNIPADLADAERIPRQRASVANHLTYRAYRGTSRAIECAFQDATGWPVYLVEGLERQFTSSQQDIRPSDQPSLLDMMTADIPAAPPDPFSDYRTSFSISRTPVTPPTAKDTVALYYWREKAVERSDMEALPLGDDIYSLDPLGRNIRLVLPVRRTDSTTYSLPTPLPVPMSLTRLILRDTLITNPAQITNALTIRINGLTVPTNRLFSGDLGKDLSTAENNEWRRKAREETLVLIDPEYGRLKLFQAGKQTDPDENRVQVTSWISDAGDIGGGIYDRGDRLVQPDAATRMVLVANNPFALSPPPAGYDAVFSSLQSALNDWQTGSASETIIQLVDNNRHAFSKAPLSFQDKDRTLVVQAAQGFSPTIYGSVQATSTGSGNELWIGGCYIAGQVELTGNMDLTLVDCTLWQEATTALRYSVGDDLSSVRQRCSIQIDHSLTGPLSISARSCRVSISDSTIDGQGGAALQGPEETIMDDLGLTTRRPIGAPVAATDTTFLGDVSSLQILETENVLIVGTVETPEGKPLSPLDGIWISDDNHPAIEMISRRAGHSGFAVLAPDNPFQVLTGGSDGGEFGVFHNRFNAQRLRAGRQTIQDFCPIDMQVDFIDVGATLYRR